MKTQLLPLALAISLLTGCVTPQRVFSLGMDEEEFKAKNSGEQLLEMSAERTVYLVRNKWDGTPQYYFYFAGGKLTRVDEGQRGPNVVIENRQR